MQAARTSAKAREQRSRPGTALSCHVTKRHPNADHVEEPHRKTAYARRSCCARVCLTCSRTQTTRPLTKIIMYSRNSENYRVAVVGATGAVGQKVLQVLEERK